MCPLFVVVRCTRDEMRCVEKNRCVCRSSLSNVHTRAALASLLALLSAHAVRPVQKSLLTSTQTLEHFQHCYYYYKPAKQLGFFFTFRERKNFVLVSFSVLASFDTIIIYVRTVTCVATSGGDRKPLYTSPTTTITLLFLFNRAY